MTVHITRAMILAAGRGERMRPLTDHCPKPLLEVGGRPLIVWHLHALAAAGVTDIVINLAWQGAKLREVLRDGEHYGVRIVYSDEGERALETAGGIHNALPLLGSEPFLVVNGDIWTDWRLPEAGIPLKEGDEAWLVLVANPDHHPHGDFSLDGDRAGEAAAPRYTFSGIGCYRASLFQGCRAGAFPLKPLLQRAIEQGRLGATVHPGQWFDIGTPERLARLDARLREGTVAGTPA